MEKSATGTALEVTLECHRAFLVPKSCRGTNSPRDKLGCVRSPARIVFGEASIQVAGDTNVDFVWLRFRFEDGNVTEPLHRVVGSPSSNLGYDSSALGPPSLADASYGGQASRFRITDAAITCHCFYRRLEPVAGLEQVRMISGNLSMQPESFRLKKLQQFALLCPDNKALSVNFNYYFSFRSLFLQCCATCRKIRVGARFGARS
jgi:hypothetical protein